MHAHSYIGVTIPNNEALSDEIDLGNNSLVAIEFPNTWAGTQITFQSKVVKGNAEGSTDIDNLEIWRNVYDSAGNELVVTVGSNRIVTDIPELAPLRFIRIRSGTSTTPVNQSPTKMIRVITKV